MITNEATGRNQFAAADYILIFVCVITAVGCSPGDPGSTASLPESLRDIPANPKIERNRIVGLDFAFYNRGDAARLTALPHLTSLLLGATGFDDAEARYLRNLPRLQVLDLVGTKVTDATLPHLKSLTRLNTLDLSHTGVTDVGLTNLIGLKNLHALRLGNTRLTDASLPHLLALRQLEQLNLEQSGLTSNAVATVRAALPHCYVTH